MEADQLNEVEEGEEDVDDEDLINEEENENTQRRMDFDRTARTLEV